MSRGGGRRVVADLSADEFAREAYRAGFDFVNGDWFALVCDRTIRVRSLAPTRRERLCEMLEARNRCADWMGQGVLRHG